MQNDLVSIITPLYNSEEFISETIESVLVQSYSNWEMIIVDDCSTDNGVNIVKKYKENDNRIKLVQLKKNSGAAVARNTAIKVAKGRYISFLDSDDLWQPEKLEKQIQFMQENDYAFTYTNYQKMTESGELVNGIVKSPSELNYEKALHTNYIGCLTAMYDTNKLGKICMPEIRKRQDYGLWLKILKQVDGHGLNENLAYYRVRNNSVSSNKIDLLKYNWKLYRDIENLSILRSLYNILYTIILKLLKKK
ncbi:glycosyltransferase family 2 protein [Halanaerobium salsuginis]|uniref:Glycosyltransferase involved in cell wall bisynthesis n=1 Tax=Halanaerobium salsuginis TaxID=29563 RepID=A0A1I4N1S0_9FIRM|nr:glycosyltransferase family 2 protein [Halanaerobium salsuginis]SFM09183.1 Glycosyltransferase involved in cell wall bisynthesis [Halanaerobium salsuginis]